ncbi:MAG TPA: radical SAM protein [Polyangia bacterium]
MRVLLLTPPMIQINTPYPATAYLTGFLRRHGAPLGIEVRQADPALMLFLRLFSRQGISEIAEILRERKRVQRRGAPPPPPSIAHFLAHTQAYVETVDAVVRFLQGNDPSLALRIRSRVFFPEGPRFAPLQDPDVAAEVLGPSFGTLGTQDEAKYLASLYIDDLADVIRDGIDTRFELSRYAERLAASAASFDPLRTALSEPPTLVDLRLEEITGALIEEHAPDVVGLSLPFPGNVYAGFRMAQTIKAIKTGHSGKPPVVVMGGGYVNTELRDLTDPRVFDHVDYLTLDDGERPLLSLLEHLQSGGQRPLFRTMVRSEGQVVLKSDPAQHDIPHGATGAPTYDGLPLARYVSLLELPNPMHRLWSDGRWNKLTVAHGCYWKKCTFCDISLDYIGRYEMAPADELVDRIEALVRETGQTGFHFVDEAAPPAALRALAERLIAREVVITWWGNIRFEKTFTPELTQLLARSGCIAVTGGLEAASDRLLDLMDKGVSVAQVARVTRAFSEAGIMVHAYLMYGFPSETEQETIDALERVRQLFEAGCIQSAFWHRFTATAHSPIGLAPQRFGIRIGPAPEAGPRFARNDLSFTDPVGTDHDYLGEGLRKAIYNYMHGLGLDQDVRSWFPPRGEGERNSGGRPAAKPRGSRPGAAAERAARFPVPPAKVPADLIKRALAT